MSRGTLAPGKLGWPRGKARTTGRMSQKGGALASGRDTRGTSIVRCALPPLSLGSLGALPGQARPPIRVPALSLPGALARRRPPPHWEACLSAAWRSAELSPQRPHCAHPTDPLGRRAEAASSEAPPLGGSVVLEARDRSRVGPQRVQVWRGTGPGSRCICGCYSHWGAGPWFPPVLGSVPSHSPPARTAAPRPWWRALVWERPV